MFRNSKKRHFKNKRTVLIDDLLATGGTASAAIKLLEKIEVNISAFSCLIELANLKGREKITVKTDSLLTFDE